MISDIYNFEYIFETAIGQPFLKSGFLVWTASGKLNDDGTVNPVLPLQKDRPRIELMFTKGPDQGHLHLNEGEPYIKARWTGYSGSLTIALVTEPVAAMHFAFLVQIRNICAQLTQNITLTNHTIHFPVKDGGETHEYKSAEGYWVTKTRLNFVFSIDRSAWPLLLTQP